MLQDVLGARYCPDSNYLEGHGDLVSRLIIGITRFTMWVIRVVHLPTKSS